MALFSRNSGTELPSESQVEYPNRSGRRWPVLVAYIIAALLVATAVVFIGRWIYHQTSDSQNTSNVSTKQGAKSSNPPAQQPAQTAAPNPTSNNGAAPSPTAKNNTATPPPAPSTGSLPNNGPGEVVALFVGTSAIAAMLHYTVILKRTK
jgi:cytoskeletal protein RodZ